MRGTRAGLVVVLVVGTSACSLVDRGATCPGPRAFYLTKGTVQGNQAPGACASGYHMASRFEIANVSSVVYDVHLGLTTEDSGSGPPSMAAKYTSRPTGWIRTGGDAGYSGATDPPGSADVNCSAWSTNSAAAFGTVAYLTDKFAVEQGAGAVWNGGPEHCDTTQHVWCIGDFPAREQAPESYGGRGRHRRGGG
jgi:hypothetical protein